MITYRNMMRGAAEGLRDMRLLIAWKLFSAFRRRPEPDGDDFGRFLTHAGGAADPDRDRELMRYWLVTRRMPARPMPEALDSAWNRFRGRRRRDPERARIWREYVLRWAELNGEEGAMSEPGLPREGHARLPGTLHEAVIGASFDVALPSLPPVRSVPHPLRRTAAGTAVVAVLLFATWMAPTGGRSTGEDLPSVSSLGIEQLERGSKSLVEQALRARYIETLHEVQRVRITAIGEEMDFQRILLEGARLDVERAMERHRRAGRVPPRLYLLLGKLSLMTEFETEGRRSLARAANYGGATGQEARELLALLPD